MIDVLLFQNDNSQSVDKGRDKRIESFGQTLNDAYKQFAKLWDDYKELLNKCEESKSSSNDIKQKVQNVERDADQFRCRASRSSDQEPIIRSEKETSTSPSKSGKLDNDPITVIANADTDQSSKPLDGQTFQIFFEDFSTQSLEESFINQSKEPLQEIQNVDSNRPKSPIIGSKKEKTRISFLPNSSPSLSDKSVVIINDFDNVRGINNENRSISDSSFQSNHIVASTNAPSSPVQLSLSVPPVLGTPPAPKNIRKWGISTVHNVNTDIIVGKNKKLKQSKLFMKTEKVTDLSNCDDFFGSKLEDSERAIDNKIRNGATKDTNLGQPSGNNSLEEDNVIQGSPEHRKKLSKIRKRMARKNKSIEPSQQKFNIDESALRNESDVEDRVNFVDADTDMTVFDPKVSSTQCNNLPFSSSKILSIEKSPVGGKPYLGERMDVENEENNDSNVIDETMFDENLIPSTNRSQEKSSSEKKVKKKKLSLKKFPIVLKNLQGVQNNEEISAFDKGIDPTVYVSGSPPRKKVAFNNYNVLPRKKTASPTYAYKGSPVRKKDERALLNGWSCMNCQKYYEGMELNEEELQDRKNKCSRHRSKFNEKPVTQKDYWDPDFTSSFQSTMWSDD